MNLEISDKKNPNLKSLLFIYVRLNYDYIRLSVSSMDRIGDMAEKKGQ